jgi:hypothetical protein
VEYPCTPPPSPQISGSPPIMYREDNLVHINMMLVDKDAPNFISHYEGVSICHASIFIPVIISLYMMILGYCLQSMWIILIYPSILNITS